jgi:DNA-binding response OmpR family regulator
MARVLVVERRDPPRAAALLEAEGFTVVTAIHRGEAATVIESFRPDLVLVESAAPGSGVVEFCALLRSTVTVPLVLVSGAGPERDAVAAFTAGVDSVILEPVGQHELVARVRAVLRRTPPVAEVITDSIVVGPIVLDHARRELFVHGALIRVPRREFDIAELLMRDAGRVVTRQAIVRELWGTVRDTKSLDVQVGRLRSRLAAAEGRRRILTVRGVGFRFLVDDDPELEPVDLTLVSAVPGDMRSDLEVEVDLELEAGSSPVVVAETDADGIMEGSASA